MAIGGVSLVSMPAPPDLPVGTATSVTLNPRSHDLSVTQLAPSVSFGDAGFAGSLPGLGVQVTGIVGAVAT